MSVIAITLGDPAGIGPEIVLRVLAAASVTARAKVVVFGHRSALLMASQQTGVALPADVKLREPEALLEVVSGQPNRSSGAAQVAYLEAATNAAIAGEFAGICTAPISKSWARKAGFEFSGHTEFLADRLGAAQVTMMFAGPRMKVALATTHLPLCQVPKALHVDTLVETITQLHASLRNDFGIAEPRVGVVGLNPHAGEGGLLGDEELSVIAPAIARARNQGIDSHGPLIPDAAFRDHLAGHTDGVVALYHDQGLIPVKLIDFDSAVNVTLGLPIVRTSPDHGTAYDIAGQARARTTSMQAALDLAFAMVESRAKRS